MLERESFLDFETEEKSEKEIKDEVRRAKMRALQDENNFTELMVLNEELKTAPLGDVWAEYLRRQGVCADYLSEIKKYETEVLSKR